LTFAVQEEPLGSAHAVLAAEAAVGGRAFVVVNADNVYPPEVVSAVRTLEGSGLAGFGQAALIEGGIAEERIASFALLDVDAEGFLVGIREKPGAEVTMRAGRGALVSMTCWRFEPSVFEACRAIERSPRGELELPDAVAWLVARGERFRVIPVDAGVLDLTSREDVPRMAEALRAGRVDL
jgi:glucose-1-phosphate thymidylyltransferase